MSRNEHYSNKDGLLMLSYNGIITAINSNRNYGKTWTFLKRAFIRGIKRGKKTIWLRMFQKEVKEFSQKIYRSRDLQRYCGISWYDKKTNPNGNFKKEGNVCFCRKSPRHPWTWFLQIFKLSDADAVRSADDVDVDTLIFDEYTKTPDKLSRYRGNVVTDFLDIWFSAKREHAVRCFLLGNKEGFNNPFYTYFGINPPPADWEGIRAYRNGSFVIQQINNLPSEDGEFNKKTKDLLSGTTYGDYIYKSTYKAEAGTKPRKTPREAILYVQLVIKSMPLRICVLNGYYYVSGKMNESRQVYCDRLYNKYKNERVLVKRQKRFFYALVDAIADNRVYYDSALTYEAMLPFRQWLGI